MNTEPLKATLRERLRNLQPGEFFLTGRIGRPYQEQTKEKTDGDTEGKRKQD